MTCDTTSRVYSFSERKSGSRSQQHLPWEPKAIRKLQSRHFQFLPGRMELTAEVFAHSVSSAVGAPLEGKLYRRRKSCTPVTVPPLYKGESGWWGWDLEIYWIPTHFPGWHRANTGCSCQPRSVPPLEIAQNWVDHGATVALSGGRGKGFSCSIVVQQQPQTCNGYRTGIMACLFQPKLGLYRLLFRLDSKNWI